MIPPLVVTLTPGTEQFGISRADEAPIRSRYDLTRGTRLPGLLVGKPYLLFEHASLERVDPLFEGV